MRVNGVPTVADWRAVVYRHRAEGVSNGVRVLLVYLADHMNVDRTVSVPRSQIAADLGVSASEIRTRLQAARAAGLLDTVRRGRPGVTAVYAATFPKAAPVGATTGPRGGHDVAPLGNPGVPKDAPEHGTGNPPSNRAPYGNPGVPAKSKHNVRNTAGEASPAEGSTSTLTRRAMQCTEEADPGEGVAPARSAGGETAEGGSVVSSADRANRKALIDALQDYVRLVFDELDEDAWLAASDRLDALLDDVEDGLADWAADYWTFPRNCATSRYAAGTQLNKLINTYRSEAA